MTATATVTLVRHAAHPNRIRAYRLFVDDREVAQVKNGGTATAEVPTGTHRLFVKIDWIKSGPLEVTLEPGGSLEVDCVTTADPIQIMLAALGRSSTHISLHRRDESGLLSHCAAELTRVDPSKPKKAALWFAGCIAVGFALSMFVGGLVESDAAGNRISGLIGQVSGFVGVMGAGWIFVRRTSKQ